MNDSQLNHLENEIRQLSERLERIENRLGVAETANQTTPDVVSTESKPQITTAIIKTPQNPVAPPTTTPDTTDTASGSPNHITDNPTEHQTLTATAGKLAQKIIQIRDSSSQSATTVNHNNIKYPAQNKPAYPSPKFIDKFNLKNISLEELIGGRIMAWAGGFVIVLAVIAIFMLGFQKGWWGHISPLYRCTGAAIFGIVLLIAGEYTLRKISRYAAVGLYGAGIPTLYLTVLASFYLYNLISDLGAFLLLTLVSILGFALTIRGKMLSIGIMSVISAYLSPILISGASTFAAALPMYLSAMLVISLALSAFNPRPFRPIRYVAIIAHGIIAILWLFEIGYAHIELSLVFMTGWWAMIITESVYAATHKQSATGNAVATILTTAWYVTAVCVVFTTGGGGGGGGGSGGAVSSWWYDQRGVFNLATGILSAAIALQFGSGINVLKYKSETPLDKLTICLWLQAGILLTVAAALHFTDFGMTIAWLMISLAAIETGRKLPSKGVDIFGLTVGALAILRLISLDMFQSTFLTNNMFISTSWINLDAWAILAILAIAAIHTVSHRLRTNGVNPWQIMPVTITVIGTIGWAGWWLYVGESSILTTTAWLVGVIVLVLTRNFGKKQKYFETALALFIASLAWWFAHEVLYQRFTPGWDPQATKPFLNLQLVMAFVFIAIGTWLFKIILIEADKNNQPETRTAIVKNFLLRPQTWAVIQILFLLIILSFEVEHAIDIYEKVNSKANCPWSPIMHRELWLTILWACGAFVMVLIGTIRKNLIIVGRTGWFRLTATTFAWLLYSTLNPVFFIHENDAAHAAKAIFNLQFFTGLLLVFMHGFSGWFAIKQNTITIQATIHIKNRADINKPLLNLAVPWPLIAVLCLWMGTIEIARYFSPGLSYAYDPAMARQTALSIFWALFAITIIVLGFFQRSKISRYIGLTMLSLTLLKVLFIDMAEVEMIYRVLSLFVVGSLLVITSIAYAKLAPALNKTNSETEKFRETEKDDD